MESFCGVILLNRNKNISRDWGLLSCPSDMGKTHFILYTLLRRVASHGGHLVYYCNRKFLSLQNEGKLKAYKNGRV